MSPIQGYCVAGDFSHGLRHGLQLVTPLGVNGIVVGLVPKTAKKRQSFVDSSRQKLLRRFDLF